MDAPGSVGGSLSVGAVSRGSYHRRKTNRLVKHVGIRRLLERNQGSGTWVYCNLNYEYFGL